MTPPPFGTFPKIHPFWKGKASLTFTCFSKRGGFQHLVCLCIFSRQPWTSWKDIIYNLIKLQSVLMTIEKDPQVCVDEHFQHEVASRDPALVCSGEKSQRHLAHWDQDHHDQSLVGDTFRWEDVDRISRSFHLLDISNPCWCPLPSWSSWWLWEGKVSQFPAPASVRGCWAGFGENPASGSELKKRRWEEAARSKLKHLSSLPSLTQSTRG